MTERRTVKRVHPTDRIRFGLRFKIIFGLTLFNILGTAVFAWNHYRIEKQATIEGVQQKLAAAARALPAMLPDDYFDRAVSADGISEEEYTRYLHKLSAYCNDTGLIYLYSYYVKDGRFHTTSSNGTPEEMASGEFATYWEEYENPILSESWKQWRAIYGETGEEDQWDQVYFLFTPQETAQGTRYIVGADIAISYLYASLDASLRKSILIGFVSFFVVFAFSFWLGTRVSRKITRLADYTRSLAESDFQPVSDARLRQEVVRLPGQSRDEIAQLASSFIAMESRLNAYLIELTETTATKERLRNELKIAGDIQLSMLPQEFDSLRKRRKLNIDLHATVKPAKEAGGDLYDFFLLDEDNLCFMVGDVSDKGMPAALFMTVTITLLRAKAMSEFAEQPESILARANELLVEQNSMCQFVTLFVGVINVRTGVVTYANGGHNRPYLCRAGKAAGKLAVADDGVALGIIPDVAFSSQKLTLAPGDALYLYSDGVTEAVAADGSFFGEDRLEAQLDDLAARPDATARQWVESSLAGVLEFSDDNHQADDITILVLRFLPDPSA